MRIAVVANGTWDKEWGKRELAEADYVICADGGGNAAIASGRLPDALIGDLDSVTGENLAACRAGGTEILSYPGEKDETDLELALHYAVAKMAAWDDQDRELYLYGGLGGRADHQLGNIALMLGWAKQGVQIRAKDPAQELWVIRGREEIAGKKGQLISLIILSDEATVSTEGLYYPLCRARLEQTTPRGISNVFNGDQGIVMVEKGWVLAVLLSPEC